VAEALAASVASLPGVRATSEYVGELVAHADRDSLPALMTTLRDDPRFAFEQLMDVCGVDWPERPNGSMSYIICCLFR
jgi:NADH-quinone oxidoreductase subunit C